MKKSIAKFCSMALSLTMITSAIAPLTTNAIEKSDADTQFSMQQPFVKIEDENGIRYIGATGDLKGEIPDTVDVIDSKEDYCKTVNQSRSVNTKPLLKATSSLPDSADNSQSKYFPPIGSQGGLGACAAWACAYYQLSYELNRANKTEATPETTMSPKWTYNLINGGTDVGSFYVDLYSVLESQGAVPISMVPYDGTDYLSWVPDEEVWRESIRNRIKGYQDFKSIGNKDSQITSPDDSDLEAIKTSLANGDVLTYSTYIRSWVSTKLKTNSTVPENSKFEGQEAITHQSGQVGAHRMTLVGYNDNIWVDVNGNDKVDDGEMGAFKIANSWGTDYANDGFAWIAYDALNEVSAVENGPEEREKIFEQISRIDVASTEDSQNLYLKFTLNSSDRSQMKAFITGEKDGTVITKKFLFGANYASYDNRYSFDGTTNAGDGTFIFPLAYVFPEITPENIEGYSWSLNFVETEADGNKLIIKDAQIVYEDINKTYRPDVTFPVTLDGNELTWKMAESNLNNEVVYYIGYDNPTIHYKKDNGTWESAKMTENLERHGYMYKYVVENTDSATVYFSDDNGNIDNNNGKYFTADQRLNYFSTKNVRPALTVSDVTFEYNPLDVGQRTLFNVEVSGGYEPYNYQYTIENLETGETKVIDFDYASEKSYVFRAEGNYKITAEVMDYSNEIASLTKEVFIEDVPFKFAELKPDSDKLFVGENIRFEANTQFESVISWGNKHSQYKFIIKDSQGNECYTNEKRSNSFNSSQRKSTIYLDWTPTKADTYTISVSSTDANKDYAEIETTFVVNNKIIGDANGDAQISIKDTSCIQKYNVEWIDETEIFLEMADSDKNDLVNIKDATLIQMYLADYSNSGDVGKVIEYIPPVTEPETTVPVTEPTTTQPVTAPNENKVTFTNSHNWSGTMYCYYWSDSNKNMISWPGKAMTNSGKNEYNQTLYTFEVPSDATYIIFSNGSQQTVDISYSGGSIRYYPLTTTDSQGHYQVKTW